MDLNGDFRLGVVDPPLCSPTCSSSPAPPKLIMHLFSLSHTRRHTYEYETQNWARLLIRPNTFNLVIQGQDELDSGSSLAISLLLTAIAPYQILEGGQADRWNS